MLLGPSRFGARKTGFPHSEPGSAATAPRLAAYCPVPGCGGTVVPVLGGGVSGGGARFCGLLGGGLLSFDLLLHEDLVPLVGCPPKVQGISSWKKCGMSVVKVLRASSKKSARAGEGAAAARIRTAVGKARRSRQRPLAVTAISPGLGTAQESAGQPASS